MVTVSCNQLKYLDKRDRYENPPLHMTAFRYHLMPSEGIDRSDNKKISTGDLMNKVSKVNKTYIQYLLILPYKKK